MFHRISTTLNPLCSVTQYVAKIKVAAENYGIPERGETGIEKFTSGRAAEAFYESFYVDSIGIDTVGVQAWSDALNSSVKGICNIGNENIAY